MNVKKKKPNRFRKDLKISGVTGNRTLTSALRPVIAKVRVRFPSDYKVGSG